MGERRWRSSRTAWLGGTMVAAAAAKTAVTAALGRPFDPLLVTAVMAGVLAGSVLWVVGTEPPARPLRSPAGSLNGTGHGRREQVVNPAAFRALVGLSWVVFAASVVTHVAALVPTTGLSPGRAWPVLVAAGAAPFAAGLAWVAAYQMIRERALRPPDRLRAEMAGQFWAGGTIGPVLLALAYAVVLSLTTRPPPGDALPAARGDESVVVVAGGERILSEDEYRAIIGHEMRVRTATAVAWSLWGVLAIGRLRTYVRRPAAAKGRRPDGPT